MATILLAYAPKDGATRAVADLIATLLRERGFAVDERLAAHVDALWEADAVVLGGALRTGGWAGDARRFVERHARALEHKPFALFAVVAHELDRAAVEASQRELDGGGAAVVGARPFATAVFGVGADPETLRLPLGDASAHDGAGQAIQRWTEGVAASLDMALRRLGRRHSVVSTRPTQPLERVPDMLFSQ